jgi:DNA-binding MarR family transcriptional regulator
MVQLVVEVRTTGEPVAAVSNNAQSPEAVVGLMREVIRVVQTFLADCAGASRLNQTDFQALLRLVAAEGMTGAELRRILGISGSSMTELADRLERARLITRVRPPSDRRIVILTPSARGRRVIDRAVGPALKRMAGIVAALQSEERAAVARFLQDVVRGLEEANPKRTAS